MRIPANESEMDIEWLVDCLGCAPQAIESVEVSSPNAQSGLFGAIAFLDLKLKPGSTLPTRLVCKYLPPDPTTAAAVREYEVFAREENFYRNFAPLVSIRTPRCHASKYDPDLGTGFLLLEDCSNYQARDMASELPSSLDELKKAINTSAKLCSSSWDRPWLIENPLLLRPGQHVWDSYYTNMTAGWSDYLEHELSSLAAPGFNEVAADLSKTYIDRLRESWPRERLSLSHVDFHCGNYFYDENNPEDPIVVFDWQGGALGRTAQDLSVILATSFPPNFRKQHERELINCFYQGLQEEHRAIYSEDECWADYEYGILVSLRLFSQFVNEIDLSSEYGAKVGAKAVRNLSSAVMDLGGMRFLDRIAS